MLRSLLAVMLLAGSARAGEVKDVSGLYHCADENMKGDVSIRKTGDTYQVNWKVRGPLGQESLRQGVGILDGDTFAVSCCLVGAPLQLKLYKVEPGPRLVGKSAELPGKGALGGATLVYVKALPVPKHVKRWKEGDTVLVKWSMDDFWYPATVTKVEKDRYFVHFHDGTEEWTDGTMMTAEDLAVGDRISGRFRQGPDYYPGVIKERKGATVHIRYDDGDEETALLNILRVRRPNPADPTEKEGTKL